MPTDLEVHAALQELEAATPGSDEFAHALQDVIALAQAGSLSAVRAAAEICAFEPSARDPALAYYFYNLSFGSESATAAFRSLSASADDYVGVPGDFRNEAQVWGVIAELGVDRCHELDRAADAWREKFGEYDE